MQRMKLDAAPQPQPVKPQQQPQQPLQRPTLAAQSAVYSTSNSIADQLRQIGQQGKAGAAPRQQTLQADAARPIVQEELDRAWSEYVRNLPETETQMISHMSVQPRANGSTVEVVALTQIQATELMQSGPLLRFLREKLGNLQLTIKATVDASATPVKVFYTKQQKFDKMAEDSELFKKMVERFSLQID